VIDAQPNILDLIFGLLAMLRKRLSLARLLNALDDRYRYRVVRAPLTDHHSLPEQRERQSMTLPNGKSETL